MLHVVTDQRLPPSLQPPGLMVFFISAVFHEVLVGVPLHMLRLWAFWGLMLQVGGGGAEQGGAGARAAGVMQAPGRDGRA